MIMILKDPLKNSQIHVIKHSERVKNTFSSLECGSNNKEVFIFLNLKTFISDIEVDLDKISKLPKKYFMWKDNRDENIHIGTSAQAVEELYPELVRRDKKGDLTVDYSKLSIIALKAIDMLNEERKQMKEDIAAIKSKLGL